MDDFEKDLEEQLKNPSFKSEYDKLLPQYEQLQIDIEKSTLDYYEK